MNADEQPERAERLVPDLSYLRLLLISAIVGVPGSLAACATAAIAAICGNALIAAVLVTLLLGPNAEAMTPIVLIAVVIAFVSARVNVKQWNSTA